MKGPAQPAPVIIVGGGWAGIAAAVELVQAKIPVLLLESARQLGGRARTVRFGKLAVDNGQHLLIGAYHETLRLLSVIGQKHEEGLFRLPLELRVHGPASTLKIKTATFLPAPFHLSWGLVSARGMSLRDRWRALSMSGHLWLSNFILEQDTTVAELLKRHHQTPLLIEQLWEPLCLAALNTPTSHASAKIFLRVLNDSFSHSRHDADLLIPRSDLGALFPRAAFDFIEQHGGLVHLNQRVTKVSIKDGRVDGVTVGDQQIEAAQVIIATPPSTTARLLANHAGLDETARKLRRLNHEPIVTVYLRYPEDCRLQLPMIGMAGTLSQWVFDRRTCGQPGVIAVVISGGGEHMELDNETLTATVTRELAVHHPHWPEPQQSLVIREKRATFHCGVDIDQLRPDNTTDVEGLWLAGDYTATGYPATLEGAVRSGVQCAQALIASSKHTLNPSQQS